MSEKLNVLIVTQFFPPESMGGAHRWEKLAANLDDGIEPHILTTQPTFPFGEFERQWNLLSREFIDDIPVTRLFAYQPTHDSRLGRVLNYGVFTLLSTLYVLLNFWRYDSIITMSAPHTTFLPGLLGKLTGRKWFIDIFDLWIDNAADLGYVQEESLLHRVVNHLERIAFARGDAVLVITETMAEYYESKYPHIDFEIQVVPFGVDGELFSPNGDHTETTDIIYTGNLGTGQALEPFFKGFSELNGEPKLRIVGDGERRDELLALVKQLDIEKRVVFEGYVPRSEIPELLTGAKLSIVPLKTEYQLDYAQPTKLLESMAVGTPFLASHLTEIHRIASKTGAGMTCDNNVDEIRKKMEYLLAEANLEEMGENSKKYIESQHSWDQIGEQCSQIIFTNN